jgi:hypothetical protein
MWPGDAESNALGIDLNEFHLRGLHRVFFVKPNANLTGKQKPEKERSL